MLLWNNSTDQLSHENNSHYANIAGQNFVMGWGGGGVVSLFTILGDGLEMFRTVCMKHTYGNRLVGISVLLWPSLERGHYQNEAIRQCHLQPIRCTRSQCKNWCWTVSHSMQCTLFAMYIPSTNERSQFLPPQINGLYIRCNRKNGVVVWHWYPQGSICSLGEQARNNFSVMDSMACTLCCLSFYIYYAKQTVW